MRPHDFDYLRATDIDHALDALAEYGSDAKLIAGGQSLLPLLNMRLARPVLLIDIGRIPELRYVEPGAAGVHVGANVRHWDVEAGALGRPARAVMPVLAKGAGLIGHHPIRTRGTVGGSLAHADPAAEWCLLAQLLDAEITVLSRAGSRKVPINEFLQGFLTTSLAEDELVTDIHFSFVPTAAHVMELTRRHGDFPIVSVAVAVRTDSHGDHGHVEARVAVGAVGETAQRIRGAEECLRAGLSDEAVAEAADQVRRHVSPASDIHASAGYRRELAAVLTRRSLLAAREQRKGAQG